MKILSLFLLFISSSVFSQTSEEKTVLAYGLSANLNYFGASSISYSDFKSFNSTPDFFIESSNADYYTPSKTYARNAFSASLLLQGPRKLKLGPFQKCRINVGLTYSSGENLKFDFAESYSQRYDTIQLTSSSGLVETLYRDTAYQIRTNYTTSIKTAGLFGEFLMFTGGAWPSLATGVGVSFQATVSNVMVVQQTTHYETGIYTDFGEIVYIEPAFSPVTGTLGSYSTLNLLDGSSDSRQIIEAYYLTPYVPLRLESALSNKGLLSRLSLQLIMKIGTEIQIVPSKSVSSRLFYSIGAGLNYYL